MGEYEKEATISPCGTYRYMLERAWDRTLPTLGWVMLNPSTADAEQDDPTIRRCVSFARLWGYGSIAVANVFGLRSTDPRELAKHPDPVGPKNDHYLAGMGWLTKVVAAWGANHMAKAREDRVRHLLAGNTVCLGVTKGGSPRHPLYVASATSPVPWRPLMSAAKEGE